MSKKFYQTLDRRHTGFGCFRYFIQRPKRLNLGSPSVYTRYESVQLFNEWREWCWTTWGASKELHEWLEDLRFSSPPRAAHNPHWCWSHETLGDSRIYLIGDAELTLFTLKWA